MASKNAKIYALPTFQSGDEFDHWLREIELWQCITDLDIKKQGPAIYLSLEGQARQHCADIDIKQLNSTDGVDDLIKHLKIYMQEMANSLHSWHMKSLKVFKDQVT